MEAVDTAPAADSFTSLHEHQQETPHTFFGGPAILHLHCPDAKVLISRSSLGEYTLLQSLLPAAQPPPGDGEEVVIPDVQIWVSSKSVPRVVPQRITNTCCRNVILFSNTSNRGLSISYPSIGLHALGSSPSPALSPESNQVVFLQLNLHDAETINSDDDLEILDITLLPLCVTASTAPVLPESEPEAPLPPAKALFEALSACADLHPDPQTPGSEEDGPEPGEGGWITAENMDRFVDADGDFSLPLGPGAGRVHGREDGGDEEGSGLNGGGTEETDDTKWQRTA
jgi:chloride channel, nucleotide-sensitive, 1A